ncbi:MAG TPA: hypothetical protein VG496_09890 [Myxococcales bacterium]|nr:hypothetical protein [Myxococcales bacterium]
MRKSSINYVLIVSLVVCAAPLALRADDRCREGRFLLGGNARNDQDPENPANDVIRIDTAAPPLYGTVSRSLGVKIAQLDNMLEFKSYFQNRSCGGGSPRIQLSIDLDGDGKADGNAFAYTAPPFAGCPPLRWQYDDVTDELPRWDVSQLVAHGFTTSCDNPTVAAILGPLCPFQSNSGYIPWPVFKALLTALFPNHRVCTGALVDDSGWFAPAAGVAFYDIISLGRATWHNRTDSDGRGFASGCGEHGDDTGGGD